MEQEVRRTLITGKVVSDNMDKTIVVQVERRVRHPLYRKIIRKHSKFSVHDENNEAKIGDTVVAAACRPLSKNKSFTLKEIVTANNGNNEASGESS